jgi:hypothetical protein
VIKIIPRARIGIAFLLAGILACRPVIAIGWDEFLILVVIIGVLFGPLLFRFYRAFNKIRGPDDAAGKRHKEEK